MTQQLARNSLPLGGRTLSRKMLEAMVALRIEREFTKQQILELYMNRIYFGSGCYGVETASQAYFGKNASKLNLSEAAMLAGLDSQSESFLAVEESGRRGHAARHGARSHGRVEENQPPRRRSRPSRPRSSHPKRLPQIQENYAMDAVQRDLNMLLTQEQIDNGGLYIYTTLDPAVQNAATQALETQLTKVEHQSEFPSSDKGELSAAGERRGFFDALPGRGGGRDR